MKMDNWVTVDTEVFSNYFLIMFRKIKDGKSIYFEKINGAVELTLNDIVKITTLLKKYTIVTFNGLRYDMLIIEAALAGFSNAEIKKVSDMIIVENLMPWEIRNRINTTEFALDHIDLINVAPSKASLKVYAGRLHVKTLMDLPVKPDALILPNMTEQLRYYCNIDNENTALLCSHLSTEIELRISMSEEYGIDLRSKSDSQIAETIIKKELKDKYGIDAKRPELSGLISKKLRFVAPNHIRFETEKLQKILTLYESIPITLTQDGHCEIDFNFSETDKLTRVDYNEFFNVNHKKKKVTFKEWISSRKQRKLDIEIGQSQYRLGVGGIHSKEKSISHYSNDKYVIREFDVRMYYPSLIVNNKISPPHIGNAYLEVYQAFLDLRQQIKNKLKTLTFGTVEHYETFLDDAALKIILNSLFGKLGSKWSCFFSPGQLISTTISGQLEILMLIEKLELNGVFVISGNTDGVLCKIPIEKENLTYDIICDWELETGYIMENENYVSVHSRDVSNYIAIKSYSINNETELYSDNKYNIKGKGAYSEQRSLFYKLRKNPTCDICAESVKMYLKSNNNIERYILDCTDFTKFITVRTVNGGAIKNGEYVGKVIRWYYGLHEIDAIYYSNNGNKVPKSDGAVPCMTLPDSMPTDIDYNWYITEAYKILKEIGLQK